MFLRPSLHPKQTHIQKEMFREEKRRQKYKSRQTNRHKEIEMLRAEKRRQKSKSRQTNRHKDIEMLREETHRQKYKSRQTNRKKRNPNVSMRENPNIEAL